MDEPQNCWEYWKCKSKEDCLVFQNGFGRECWLINEICNKDEKSPQVKNRYKNCFSCKWFKKLNPDL